VNEIANFYKNIQNIKKKIKKSFFLPNLLLIYNWITIGREPMNNNYKIIRTIFENGFQRVLECKNDDGDIFYSNVITSQKAINLVNLEELKNFSSNIVECFNTEDRIYIYTEPVKTEYISLREIASKGLTLKQQFKLSESVISLAQGIFNMTDVVQQKILDIDKLYADEDNNVIVDLNLVFEQEYDIADNETFKRLGNIIHFIFSGSEIVDYNISDAIPPDILKIIVRCLTREYIFPEDVRTEMKNSPIYSMIFSTDSHTGKISDEYAALKKVEAKDSAEQENADAENVHVQDDCSQDSSPIFDIYVNDNQPVKQRTKAKKLLTKKEAVRAAVSILIVVLILFAGNKLIKKLSDGKEANANSGNNNSQNQMPPENNNGGNNGSGESPDPGSEITDSTEVYFNESLLTKLGYTGNRAAVDSDIYLEGKSSLVVANEGDGKVKALFAAVDFIDEKFNYMLKRQIGIAVKMKSENDAEAQIVLEASKGGSLTSNFHTKVNVHDDIWEQFTVPINVTDADSLNIYLEYEGKNRIWIDDIYIDVIK